MIPNKQHRDICKRFPVLFCFVQSLGHHLKGNKQPSMV